VDRALWLLVGLHLRGWVRYLGRNLRTVRGALLALLGLAVFAPMILASFFRGEGLDSESVRRTGPAFLLFYCVLNVLATTGERPVYFTPGEVHFLFGGPFGRRELLVYKVVLSLVFSVPSSLIMASLLQLHARLFIAAFLGLLLTFMFMQLFTMAVSLSAAAAGARLYSFSRRAAMIALAGAVGVVAWQAGLFSNDVDWAGALRLAGGSDAWYYISTPLRWFFEAGTAKELWPDLVQSALLAAVVDLVLLGVVFFVDAQYMEASAAASARIYARLQRMRRGGPTTAPAGGVVRFTLPMPVFWRQLVGAVRDRPRLTALALIFTVALVGPTLIGRDDPAMEKARLFMFPLILGLMSMFLTNLVPFDFRGDIDHLAFLKSLPVASWRIAVGQLLTPVLIYSLLQWTALAAYQLAVRHVEEWLLVGAALVVPFNCVLFGVENLVFLLFPARLLVTTPGDFQAMGRNFLLQVVKFVAIAVAALVAAVAGGIAYGVSTYFGRGENLWAVAAAAWLAAAIPAAALIPFNGWAFARLDVSRDPPT
jgi:hypothetical protein